MRTTANTHRFPTRTCPFTYSDSAPIFSSGMMTITTTPPNHTCPLLEGGVAGAEAGAAMATHLTTTAMTTTMNIIAMATVVAAVVAMMTPTMAMTTSRRRPPEGVAVAFGVHGEEHRQPEEDVVVSLAVGHQEGAPTSPSEAVPDQAAAAACVAPEEEEQEEEAWLRREGEEGYVVFGAAAVEVLEESAKLTGTTSQIPSVARPIIRTGARSPSPSSHCRVASSTITTPITNPTTRSFIRILTVSSGSKRREGLCQNVFGWGYF